MLKNIDMIEKYDKKVIAYFSPSGNIKKPNKVCAFIVKKIVEK
tara:strand:- start:812 stop:940 length:129 start_codon:yes stop_codon:yes gene_type:complete